MTELSPRDATAELTGHGHMGQRLTRASSELEAETLRTLSHSLHKLAPEIDARAIDLAARLPNASLRALQRAGFFALTIPQEDGGLGLSLKATCQVIERLAQLDRSVAVTVGLHCGLGTQALVQYGSEQQRRELSPKLASGEWIGAFAATEAGAGSDLTAVRTTGRSAPGGMRIRGSKSYVTNGAIAGCYTVLVRTPEHGGPHAQTLVCIPREAAGVHVGKEEDKLGLRGSSTVALDFDDVFVPDADIIGVAGQGARYTASLLALGRTLMAAGCIGTARTALAATVTHVAARRQFRRTLAEFPLVQSACADMAANVYAMESLLRLASDAAWQEPQRQFLSALAKVFCSESTYQICDRAIQLHGALGFLEPTGLPLLLRDCRITRIFEGANDVLLLHAGTHALARDWDGALPLAAIDDRKHRLQHARRAFEGVLRAREAVRSSIRQRYGVRAVERQDVLAALGHAETCQMAAYATLVRANRDADVTRFELAERAGLGLIEEAEQTLSMVFDPRASVRNEQARRITQELLSPLRTERTQ